ASNPTLALKAALCRLRFAFIGLLFIIYSKPAKIETYLWSKIRGPPLTKYPQFVARMNSEVR
ncbi:MAG TPA: hypothetical protein VMR33_16975, partial [Candidatus Baltobacteraceae bacterium]|nr:hypothetical protein [Candidatus Baltobacteraceae bacterium]